MKTATKLLVTCISISIMVFLAYVGPINASATGSIIMNYDYNGGDDPDCAVYPSNGSCVPFGDGQNLDSDNSHSGQLTFCLHSAVKYASGLSDISGLELFWEETTKRPAECLSVAPASSEENNTYTTYRVSFQPKCTANASRKCVGNSVYNFDSCGVQGSLYQACNSNQTCQNAQCVNIACSANSQCGTNGFTGSPFCQGNNIYQNYKTYTCNNPGTALSHCTNSTTAQLKTTCTAGQTCSNGQCVSACITHTSKQCSGNAVYWYNSCGTKQDLFQQCTANQTCQNAQCVNIACSANSQCGTNAFVGSPFCQSGNVYQNYKTFTCNNPGTPTSYCSDATTARLQTTCIANQVCANGACTDQHINCRTNSQCGTNGVVGNPFCQSGNVYKNYKTYTCNNPGTANSYCSDSTASQLDTTCTGNQVCANGSCTNQQVNCTTNSQCGTNGFTGSPFCQGNNVYQNYKTYTCNNPGTPTSYCSDSTASQLKTTCTANQVCANGSCTNQIIACSANSQCGTNAFVGSPFCQSGNVYQNYKTFICNNPGTPTSYCSDSTAAQLQTTCAGSQTCTNGSCTYQIITCSSNTDCGTNAYTGSPSCQGNNVYQNYKTYTCNNAGTPTSYCSDSTAAQLQTTCAGSQTCANGSCTSNCTLNYQQRCSGNNLYWYDSCGNQQNFIQYCPNGCYNNSCQNYNTCSYHSYQRCSGNYLYWYDSCGNQQDLAQYCQNGCYNNSCQNYNNNTTLNVTKTVRNLTGYPSGGYPSGLSGFSSSTYANPSDMLMFMITLQNPGGTLGNQDVQNVFVRDALPANLIYNNQLIVACTGNNGYNSNCNNNNYNYSGSIISGVNLGTIYAGQTVTITYQVQVAGAQNFSYGTTTLNNNVSVTSSNTGYTPTSNASVIVTRTAVLGASSISTGLTNNFWADSFLLPLLITLIGIWMWKAGMFFGIEKWLDNKRKIRRGYKAEKELSTRIATIQKTERT